jgi:hypothetical protein
LALRVVAASLPGVIAASIAAITVAVIAAQGAVEEFKASIRTALDDIDRAKGRLDGSTDSLRELAQALESMPILGGALGLSFRLLAVDAELADEALTDMVATVDEGEVKLKGWARLFGRGIGINKFIDDIDAANAKLAEMRAVEDSRGDFIGRTESFGGGIDAVQESAADDLTLARLRGVDAVREAEEQAARDRLSQLDEQRDAYRKQISDQLGELAKQSQQEDANFRQIRLARSALTAELNAQEQKYAEARRQTERDLARLIQERVAQAQRLADLETRRARASAQAAEREAAGDRFGAEAIRMEQRKQEAISQAIENGQQQNVRYIERAYRARLEVMRDAHQQELQAEQRQQQRRLMLMQQAMRREQQMRADRLSSVEGQIRVGNLELEGRDFDAQRQGVREEFRQQIEEAIRSGDRELLLKLQELRRIRLEQIDELERQANDRAAQDKLREQEDVMREMRRRADTSARQIDTANFAAGQSSDPKAEEKAIEKNTGKTNELLREYLTAGARAG